MSRVGKQPVEIPDGVNVDIKENVVRVRGANGELTRSVPAAVRISLAENRILVERNTDTKTDRALHGLTRSLIYNMVSGVSQGYKRMLEITGVGYRAQVRNNKIIFTLGYSHPVEYELPAGVSAAVDEKQTAITLSGIDKQLIGQVAANLKALRSPDAYKGKGIRYKGERIKLKAGKTGKK